MNKPINMTDKYERRDGNFQARILCIDAGGTHPVIALMTQKNGADHICRFTSTGQYLESKNAVSCDLVPVKAKFSGWVVIFKSSRMSTALPLSYFHTKEEAQQYIQRNQSHNIVAIVPISGTEGDGL